MLIKNKLYIIPQHKSGRKLLGFLFNLKDPLVGAWFVFYLVLQRSARSLLFDFALSSKGTIPATNSSLNTSHRK